MCGAQFNQAAPPCAQDELKEIGTVRRSIFSVDKANVVGEFAARWSTLTVALGLNA